MRKHPFIKALILFTSLCCWGAFANPSEPLFVVHFETGPAWEEGVPPSQQKGFAAHAKNLQSLRQSGTIKFGARYQEYGMIMLSAEDLQQATALLEADPGVTSGLFVFRVAQMSVFYPWQHDSEAN